MLVIELGQRDDLIVQAIMSPSSNAKIIIEIVKSLLLHLDLISLVTQSHVFPLNHFLVNLELYMHEHVCFLDEQCFMTVSLLQLKWVGNLQL